MAVIIPACSPGGGEKCVPPTFPRSFPSKPALFVLIGAVSLLLKESGRTATGVRGRRWNRSLVVEVALACAVLVASALLEKVRKYR
jgi:hypothetical protein